MKKTFTLILITALLCATCVINQTSAVIGFDPEKFETIAASKIEKKYSSYMEGPLNDALNELKDKIRSAEITLDGTETEKKVAAFIKTASPEDYQKYKYMNFVTTITLISKMPHILSKTDIMQCFNEIKQAHLQLIENDPNLSSKFKSAIKEKIEKIYIFVPGITHCADDIVEFHMDKLKLNDKGELENLEEWNNSHSSYALVDLYLSGIRDPESTLSAFLYLKNPSLIGNLRHPDYEKAKNEFNELQKNDKLDDYLKQIYSKANEIMMFSDIATYWTLFVKAPHYHKSTDFIFLPPSCIISDKKETADFNYIKNSILTILGHEMTHFILSHFNANNKSLLHNFQLPILIDGDQDTYKKFCTQYGREYNEGDELNHELVKSLREQAMEETYKTLKENYADKLALTTDSDQTYIDDIYKNFSKYVEKTTAGETFPDSFGSDLKGKPIKVSGEVYFGECMADVFGTKAAMIAATKLKIPQTPDNNIYANWFLDIWESTGTVKDDCHPISPFRFRWMYTLSQINPDMFGFEKRLAEV